MHMCRNLAMETKIRNAVDQGHNIFILGQAGTGKTRLITQLCRRKGSLCAMTATTGVAASLLPGGQTIHRFSGVMDGRFTDHELARKIIHEPEMKEVKMNILNTELLVIDEVSMLSAKIFLQIEAVFRMVRKSSLPFGGMQVVLSGDLYQLKPVPNIAYNDPGCMFIKAEQFKNLVPHCFFLSTVHRQTENDLIEAINLCCRGEIKTSVTNLLKRLQRPLPPGETPVKLFALNYDVDISNANHLMAMEGEMKLFRADDTGEIKLLSKCTAPKTLHLKVSAPIILITNLSSNLYNGLQGQVIDLDPHKVTVHFPSSQRTVSLKRHDFKIYCPQTQQVKACRKQFPIKLAFSMTVHRSQGLTLDRVEVDCRNMTQPGQIGVAIGRAKTKQGLRVLNFSPALVSSQPAFIGEFYDSEQTPAEEDLACCRKEIIQENTDVDVQIVEVEEENEPLTDEQLDETIHDFEEQSSNDNDDAANDNHDDEDQCEGDKGSDAGVKDGGNLPDDVLPDHAFFQCHTYQQPLTKEQNVFNALLSYLSGEKTRVEVFCAALWHKINQAYILSTSSAKTTLSNKHTTQLYREIASILQSDQYKQSVCSLFQVAKPSSHHFRTAFCLAKHVRAKVVEMHATKIKEKSQQEETQEVKTFKGSAAGRGKIRYVGGWCVATLKYRKKQNVMRILYNRSYARKIAKLDTEVKYLEHLTVTEDSLRNSTDPETLIETKRKQNLRGGLTNISDDTFHFFEDLDLAVRKLENKNNISVYGQYLYQHVFEKLMHEDRLFKHWTSLFRNISCQTSYLYSEDKYGDARDMDNSQARIQDGNDANEDEQPSIDTDSMVQGKCDSDSEIDIDSDSDNDSVFQYQQLDTVVKILYDEVIKKYILMSSASFRKEYLRDMKTTKEEAHRKQIRMSKPERLGGNMQPSGSAVTTRRSQPKRRRVTKWPCGKCSDSCVTESVCCDMCDNWFHYMCVGVKDDDDVENETWYCPGCLSS